MFNYLYNKPKTFYYILLFIIIPVVFFINEILNVFVGGLLIIATVLAAMYFKKIGLLIFITFSLFTFVGFITINTIPNKQIILQGSIFVVTSFLAALSGHEIKIFILNQKKHERDQCQLTIDLVHAFVTAIDAKDHYLHNHSSNVCYYAKRMASTMGLDPVECEKIALAALFHDIGKLHVDASILNKPAKLSEEEWAIMKSHVTSGVEVIHTISSLSFIFDMVKYHHRHYDGQGYPKDCPVEAIPLGARIISVADAFDAMTSDRPYRKALSYEASCQELKKFSGSQFDPSVVESFFEANIEPVQVKYLDVNMYLIMKYSQKE